MSEPTICSCFEEKRYSLIIIMVLLKIKTKMPIVTTSSFFKAFC